LDFCRKKILVHFSFFGRRNLKIHLIPTFSSVGFGVHGNGGAPKYDDDLRIYSRHHSSKHHTQARKPQSLRTGTQALRSSKGWGKLELTAAGVQVQGKRAKPGSSGERAELVILGQKRRSQRPFAKEGLSPEVV
jgi:hypothetical protein